MCSWWQSNSDRDCHGHLRYQLLLIQFLRTEMNVGHHPIPTANIDSFLFLFSHFPIIPLLLTNIYLEIGLSLMTFSVGRVPEYSLPSEKKNCNCQFLRSATCLHTVLVFKNGDKGWQCYISLCLLGLIT